MRLPEELEAIFWQEVQQYQQEKQMPYISSLERIAKQEGLREGLLSGIDLGLELKFGSEGLELLPEIAKIENVEVLKKIQAGLKTVSTLAELRSIYQQDEPQI